MYVHAQLMSDFVSGCVGSIGSMSKWEVKYRRLSLHVKSQSCQIFARDIYRPLARTGPRCMVPQSPDSYTSRGSLLHPSFRTFSITANTVQYDIVGGVAQW